MKEQFHVFLSKARNLQPGDLTFFYFSGHGTEKDGSTAVIPIDSRSNDDTINSNTILRELYLLNLDLFNIIMLDCCRADATNITFRHFDFSSSASSNDAVSGSDAIAIPVTSGTAVAARSFVELSTKAPSSCSLVRAETDGSFLIAYSCDSGTVAHEGPDGGFFTQAFLKYLHLPKPIDFIFRKAGDELKTVAGLEKKQRAWMSICLPAEPEIRFDQPDTERE